MCEKIERIQSAFPRRHWLVFRRIKKHYSDSRADVMIDDFVRDPKNNAKCIASECRDVLMETDEKQQSLHNLD
jgi:hypothetical protein